MVCASLGSFLLNWVKVHYDIPLGNLVLSAVQSGETGKGRGARILRRLAWQELERLDCG